jgi:iron complex outermembrane receptor protein
VVAHAERAPDYLLNSDTRQTDAFLGARYSAAGGAWASFSASGFTGERGVLPELHVAAPRLWRYPTLWRTLAAISGGTGMRRGIAGGTGDLEASIGVDVGRTEIAAFESLDYRDVTSSEIGDARTLSLRVLGDHSLGPRADLSAALTFADIRLDEHVAGGPAVRYRQRLWSGAAESTVRAGSMPGARDVRITIGAVLDGADTPETGGRPAQQALGAWGARLGATAVARNGSVLLHAALSRRARFPALRELYSGALGRFVPNPDLEPERLVVGELGATVTLGSAELQVVGFMHRLSDAVVRTSTPDDRFMRVNRDEQRSRGIELLALMPLGLLHLAGDLTLQHVELLDPAAAGAESRAEYQPAIVAGLNANAALPLALAGTLQARYTGAQFCVNPELGGDQELAPWTRIDAQLARAFPLRSRGRLARLEASLAVDNLLDAALYDQCGLPQGGRTLRFQVRAF